MKGWQLFFSIVVVALFSSTVGFGQVEGLDEPDIVLPPVVLEVEDLSVENVKALVPDLEELAPAELELPLPEAEDLKIEEPVIDFVIPGAEGTVYQKKEGKPLLAEGVLGVGTRNHFFSGISLYKMGELPEGKLVFKHNIMDGFSSKPPGSGYNLREDSIEGSFRLNLGKIIFQTEGSFSDIERGLQGNGDFYSGITRFIEGDIRAEYPISDRFIIRGALDSVRATQLLTISERENQESERSIEYLISPSLEGVFKKEHFSLGINPMFSYQALYLSQNLSLARARLRGFFNIELRDIYQINGDLGWFWSEAAGHQIPFDLAFQVVPSDFQTFRASLGYRVQEINMGDILRDFWFIKVYDSLRDNRGWYGELRTSLIPFDNWFFDAGIMLSDNSSMSNAVENIDLTTGLFPFYQEKAIRLSTDMGARWNISKNLSLHLGWTGELLKKPSMVPKNQWVFEAVGSEKSGRYGGAISSEFNTGLNEFIQAPVIDVNGYYRLKDFLRFVLEVDDLLSPALDGPRYSYYPYLDAGFTIKTKIYIIF